MALLEDAAPILKGAVGRPSPGRPPSGEDARSCKACRRHERRRAIVRPATFSEETGQRQGGGLHQRRRVIARPLSPLAQPAVMRRGGPLPGWPQPKAQEMGPRQARGSHPCGGGQTPGRPPIEEAGQRPADRRRRQGGGPLPDRRPSSSRSQAIAKQAMNRGAGHCQAGPCQCPGGEPLHPVGLH